MKNEKKAKKEKKSFYFIKINLKIINIFKKKN